METNSREYMIVQVTKMIKSITNRRRQSYFNIITIMMRSLEYLLLSMTYYVMIVDCLFINSSEWMIFICHIIKTPYLLVLPI